MKTRIGITAAALVATALTFGLASPATAGGATQIAGTIDGDPCTSPPEGFEASQTPDGYAFPIAGDLDGCVYGVITTARFHEGSGTYQERADEIFVSSEDSADTFRMVENYTAKVDPDNDVTGLFFARCQHPIVTGSGTGEFEGVSGRLDFKDDTVNGTTEYKGHLRY